jgi:hypothetical protein
VNRRWKSWADLVHFHFEKRHRQPPRFEAADHVLEIEDFLPKPLKVSGSSKSLPTASRTHEDVLAAVRNEWAKLTRTRIREAQDLNEAEHCHQERPNRRRRPLEVCCFQLLQPAQPGEVSRTSGSAAEDSQTQKVAFGMQRVAFIRGICEQTGW